MNEWCSEDTEFLKETMTKACNKEKAEVEFILKDDCEIQTNKL